ncbi:MAG: type II toxin-antitoxin system PemK/MazF family toxin, partial [Armatimonadota bacterium]
MGSFVRGDVVVVPFPLSVDATTKRRPALVVASWAFGGAEDYLLSLISSQNAPDPYIIALDAGDIEGGKLALKSYIRPTYLFAADEGLILYKVGT